MQNAQKLSALAVIGLMVIVVSAFAAETPRTPSDIVITPDWSPGESVPNGDQDQIVGKVRRIDREQGLVTIATEDSVLVVEPPPQTLQTMNVGDTVSVPRPTAESPSASPRE